MSADILKGAAAAEAIGAEIRLNIERLASNGVKPCLAIVRLGENPGDLSYERGLLKKCGAFGIMPRQIVLPAEVPQERLREEIENLNRDSAVHGILLFRPLPPRLDEALIRNAIAWEKDVDGVTDVSLAGVFAGGGRGFAPCTAQACLEILDHYGAGLEGKRAVVLGRSLTAGKPAAMLLLSRNATVTLCHSKTAGLAGLCREAEILVVSAGKAGMVNENFLSPGQIVIDVGINVNAEGTITGDVDFESAVRIVRAVTPVPGGVGAVTVQTLLKHTVEAAVRQERI